MKIAVNKCYGGFSMSDEAFEDLIKKGWKVTKFNDSGSYEDRNANIVDFEGNVMGFSKYSFVGSDHDYRTHPDLIETIERLNERASGQCGNIKVIEIPDDIEWEIDEYDGWESVHEAHRSW